MESVIRDLTALIVDIVLIGIGMIGGFYVLCAIGYMLKGLFAVIGMLGKKKP